VFLVVGSMCDQQGQIATAAVAPVSSADAMLLSGFG